MATQMLQRRGTEAEWAALNPVLGDGEIGFARDTKVFKIGDGQTPWSDLQMMYLTIGGGTMTGHLVILAPTNANHPARFSDVTNRLIKTGDTMTGQLTMNEQRIVRPELVGYQEEAVSSGLSSIGINFTNAQLFEITTSGGVVISWVNRPNGGKVRSATLVVHPSVSSITWPSGTRFANGAIPDLEGETWLSVVARGSTVTVGKAWDGVGNAS